MAEDCKKGFRNLGLVMWKNLLLRKRQWIVTIFEVLLPLVAIIALQFLFPAEIPEYPPKDLFPLPQNFTEWKCRDHLKKMDRVLAYTNNHPDAAAIMKAVAEKICSKPPPGEDPEKLQLESVRDDGELVKNYRGKWSQNFAAAVTFTSGLDNLKPGGQGKVEYRIRMAPQCTPSTKKLFPEPGDRGYHLIGYNRENHHLVPSAECMGFVGLQWHLDQVLIEKAVGQPNPVVLLQAMPYPKNFVELGKRKIHWSNTYLFLAWPNVFLLTAITRNVVSEKATGISELLRPLGCPTSMQWLGWILHVVVPQLIPVVLVTCFVSIVDAGDGDPMLRQGEPTLLFVMLLLFVLASCSMAFMFCAIFRKPILATSMAVLIAMCSTIFALITPQLDKDTTTMYWPSVLVPHVTLKMVVSNFMDMETMSYDDSDTPVGTKWSTLSVEIPNPGFPNKPPTRLYLISFLCQFLGYLLLAAYLDGVIPSEHGIKRPWHYFDCSGSSQRNNAVSPAPPEDNAAVEAPPESSLSHVSTVVPEGSVVTTDTVTEKPSAVAKNAKSTATTASSVVAAPRTPFEPEPHGVEVGVEVINLVKRFGKKVSVNGVSFRMFTGDIFALLGHNGAGKTTTISMLTGFFAPTSGTAIINGYDIGKETKQARRALGLCPQHNMLFENLSTIEQIRLFGMLRGLTCAQAQSEALRLLSMMNLTEKRNVLAGKLSGGQKRKLQLAMALIGGTKVVVLDEPTSGMDPQARREIWDLLLQLRGERTILLTTHFMEEADVLGDRIGIMAAGELQCCGTTTFLKKFYGTGYTLKVTLLGGPQASKSTRESDVSMQEPPPPPPPVQVNPEARAAILSTVQKQVPNASLKTDVHTEPNEVFISLHAETATTQALLQMFASLTSQKDKLTIKTIGLSQTSMDEVFVRVGEIMEETDSQHQQQQMTIPQNAEEQTYEKSPKTTGSFFIVQFVSLLKKKMRYARHRWVTLLCTFLLLFFMFLAGVHLNTHVFLPVRNEEPHKVEVQKELVLSPKIYKDPKTLYSGFGPLDMGKIIGPSAKKVDDVTKELLRVAEDGKKGRIAYKKEYPVAIEEQGGIVVRAMYNLYPYHAAPVALNLATNAILQMRRSKVEIETTNHPIGLDENGNGASARSAQGRQQQAPGGGGEEKPRFVSKKGVSNKTKVSQHMLSFVIPLGLALFLAYFVAQPIEESQCKVKQLQMMTGVSPLVYWGSTFLFDYAICFIVCIFMLLWMIIVESTMAEFNMLTAYDGWFVFLVFCLAYSATIITFCYLVSLKFNSLVRGYSLIALFQLMGIAIFAKVVQDIKILYDPITPEAVKYTMLTFHYLNRLNPSYALARAFRFWVTAAALNSDCPLFAVDPDTCPEPSPYWIWSTTVTYQNGESVEQPGIGEELFCIVIWIPIYVAWLLCVEYKVWPKLRGKLRRKRVNTNDFLANVNDDDVLNEAARVDDMLATGQWMDSESLVVYHLCKSYGSFAAVSNLQFAVRQGDCFGLLGVNGAGKTTTFRMITGDETPSQGNVYGFGTCLDGDTARFLANIGYCPQFDAILNEFTGRQMLELFAGLRGVPAKCQEQESLLWLQRFGLEESGNARCGRYSGGMKRRLSTAMAMIGDPSLILLDEPTSGVDPVSRRQFWGVLEKLRKSGQSFILTSHSFDECEALCNRLGIMVNGQLQCFGAVEHLKNKFAQGYSMTVKLKPDLQYGTPEVDETITEFQRRVEEKFQPCELKDKHQNLLQFYLQNRDVTWDVLFKTMEDIKTEFEALIEDYSVNETSLEEVFLAFARLQYPERKAKRGSLMRILTCRC